MSKHDKKTIISSLIWKLLERTGSQGVQFIVQVILARILLPEDFGTIAIVSIFILFANVFVQGGLNTALIQKKNTDEVDFSSSFYLSLIISSLLYIILYVAAPFIAQFYKMDELTGIFRVLGIILFFGSINSIQNALIAKTMQFKKQFISTFGAFLLSGVISIILAIKGFGIWALVIQQILSQLFITIIYFKIVKWRPKLVFSMSRIKVLWDFGWKVLASNLMDTLFDDIRSLIIGKSYSASMLGYYNRGRQIPSVIVNNINGSIQSVMLPALSQNQNNLKSVKSMLRRSISTSSFLIFPIMLGIIASSKSIIIVLLTEKWLPAVPFLQIFAMTYIFRPIQTTNLQAVIAVGRSDLSLKLQIYKNLLGILFLLLTVQSGVFYIALGGMASTVVSTFLNMYPNKKLINYTYKEQLGDIIPSFLVSSLMCIVVYSINYLKLNAILTLFAQIVTGIFIYYILARIFKMKELEYIKATFKTLFSRKGVSPI